MIRDPFNKKGLSNVDNQFYVYVSSAYNKNGYCTQFDNSDIFQMNSQVGAMKRIDLTAQ